MARMGALTSLVRCRRWVRPCPVRVARSNAVGRAPYACTMAKAVKVKVDDAVKLITDPANVSRTHAAGPEERFAVNAKRVIRALRDAGAGKAEARELALEALEKVGGGAELRAARAGQRGGGSDRAIEDWWVPKSAVRFQA